MGAAGEDDQPGVMVQLVRIEGGLPGGFDALRAEAEAEGHRHMARLAVEVSETPELFIALLAAFDEGELLGIGGMTPEPADPSAIRMRRLYVSQAARRRGVARMIANALLNEALCRAKLVTVHAGNPGAERFWEALGYAPVANQPWSHQFRAH
jgi:GNAT superfamily N-acetyltransferase